MKRVYRLKESIASHIVALYGNGARERIESEFNNHERKKIIYRGSRFWEYPVDTLNFEKEDFEEIVKYNPNGWNVAPDVYPTADEVGEMFLIAFDNELPEFASWEGEDFYQYPSRIIFNTSSPFKYKKIDMSNVPDIDEIREGKE